MDIWNGCTSMLRQYLRGVEPEYQEGPKKALLLKLYDLDRAGEDLPKDNKRWEERYQLEADLRNIYRSEELFWQQRGEEKWVFEGDANTAYFRTCVNGRRRKTKICSLETNEGVITEQGVICKHIVESYKQLFGSVAHNGVQLAPGFLSQEERLGKVERECLAAPFSKREVEVAIDGMKSESDPGPNGFTVTFFKRFWKLLKGDIMSMVQDFNHSTLDLKRLNYGMATLVPKIKEANNIRQYRPIYLLNVDFKISPKLLTDRITPLADDLISDSQSTFIKGRNILEGVVVLHEVLHELRRTKQQGVLFKIDFEKAYDKVRWGFVQEVLLEKGFLEIWIQQTMSIVQGGQVCINVNAEGTNYFKTYQGLRQGDPLSPLLFNLVDEVLATLMRKVSNQGKVKGVMSHLISYQKE
jgi:hypothetical protein